AGAPGGSGLPAGAFHTDSDGHTPGYEGAAPPPGDHPHRYIFAVHALDVAPGELGLGPDSTNAQVALNVYFHLLGRATLTATYSRPPPRPPRWATSPRRPRSSTPTCSPPPSAPR